MFTQFKRFSILALLLLLVISLVACDLLNGSGTSKETMVGDKAEQDDESQKATDPDGVTSVPEDLPEIHQRKDVYVELISDEYCYADSFDGKSFAGMTLGQFAVEVLDAPSFEATLEEGVWYANHMPADANTVLQAGAHLIYVEKNYAQNEDHFTRNQEFQASEAEKDRTFTASENAKNRAASSSGSGGNLLGGFVSEIEAAQAMEKAANSKAVKSFKTNVMNADRFARSGNEAMIGGKKQRFDTYEQYIEAKIDDYVNNGDLTEHEAMFLYLSNWTDYNDGSYLSNTFLEETGLNNVMKKIMGGN